MLSLIGLAENTFMMKRLRFLLFQLYLSFFLLFLPQLSMAKDTLSTLIGIKDSIVKSNFAEESVHDNRNDFMGAFYNGTFQRYTSNMPIFITGGLKWQHHILFQFGNFLGKYLHDISCAYAGGAHIVDVSYDSLEKRNDTSSALLVKFFEQMPFIVVNKNPASNISALIIKTKTICSEVSPFPWESHDGVKIFTTMVHLARRILVPAVQWIGLAYHRHQMLEVSLFESVIVNSTEYDSTTEISTTLPLYPDAVVHFRCSDNLEAGLNAGTHSHMGLNMFGDILDVIPDDAESVYVLTEGHKRHYDGGRRTTLCNDIRDALVADIMSTPSAPLVATLRGGDILSAMAIIAGSAVVVCSESTFCFHAAIGNAEGQVYLAKSEIMYRELGLNITLGHGPENLHTLPNRPMGFKFDSRESYIDLLRFRSIEYNDKNSNISSWIKAANRPAGVTIRPTDLIEGMVVKTASSRSVFLLQKGKRREFTGRTSFSNTGLDFDDVITIDSRIMERIPLGDSLR